MTPDELRRRVVEDQDLPLLPQVVLLVQKTIAEEGSSAGDLAQTILDDPVLTGRLLRLANSSFYRFSHKPISTITEAIVLLGFETVKNITLTLSVYKLLSNITKEKPFRLFWRHSLCTALASRAIAKEAQSGNPETAFVAGLLHDMGKVILAHYKIAEYRQVFKDVETGMEFSVSERQRLGLTHKEAGAVLAEHWRLPDEIAFSMSWHDDLHPKIAKEKISPYHATVYLANLIARNIYGNDKEKETFSFSHLALTAKKLFHLDSNILFQIVGRLSEQVFDIARVLDIAIDDIRIGEAKGGLDAAKLNLLQENLGRRERELKLFMTLNEKMVKASKIEEVLTTAVEGIASLLSPRRLVFAFLDETQGCVQAKFGYPPTDFPPGLSSPLTKTDDLMVRCLSEGFHINTTRLAETARERLPKQLIFDKLGTHRLGLFPLIYSDKARAVMIVQPRDDQFLDDVDESFLVALGHSLGLAFARHGWKS